MRERIVIISGGTLDKETVFSEMERFAPDTVIVADKGLAFCMENGIRPDLIVGDLDSLDAAAAETVRKETGIPAEIYRPEKDMTDSDIAIEKAIALGAGSVCAFGMTGTRLDHTLSNLYELYKLYVHGIEGYLADAHNRVYLPLEKQFRIGRGEQYGQFVSLFPLTEEVRGLTLSGFKYPLDHAVLAKINGGLGVSNEIIADAGLVSYESGILAVMETKD